MQSNKEINSCKEIQILESKQTCDLNAGFFFTVELEKKKTHQGFK